MSAFLLPNVLGCLKAATGTYGAGMDVYGALVAAVGVAVVGVYGRRWRTVTRQTEETGTATAGRKQAKEAVLSIAFTMGRYLSRRLLFPRRAAAFASAFTLLTCGCPRWQRTDL